MNNYLNWKSQTLTDFTPKSVSAAYTDGYVFTRLGKGLMQQTRSVRIDLSKFAMTSENRRILKKAGGLILQRAELALKDYDYSLGKLAKDFYETKFGPGVMSAQKIKEMLTDVEKSNFNVLLTYSVNPKERNSKDTPFVLLDDGSFSSSTASERSFSSRSLGFAICYMNKDMIHYSYPFYDLKSASKDMGLAMMTMAIQYAKEAGKKYVYLGSLQRSTDTYKLQFEGLEWFDGKAWKTDLDEVKKTLSSAKM